MPVTVSPRGKPSFYFIVTVRKIDKLLQLFDTNTTHLMLLVSRVGDADQNVLHWP